VTRDYLAEHGRHTESIVYQGITMNIVYELTQEEIRVNISIAHERELSLITSSPKVSTSYFNLWLSRVIDESLKTVIRDMGLK
jgi:hypothetical protein